MYDKTPYGPNGMLCFYRKNVKFHFKIWSCSLSLCFIDQMVVQRENLHVCGDPNVELTNECCKTWCRHLVGGVWTWRGVYQGNLLHPMSYWAVLTMFFQLILSFIYGVTLREVTELIFLMYLMRDYMTTASRSFSPDSENKLMSVFMLVWH